MQNLFKTILFIQVLELLRALVPVPAPALKSSKISKESLSWEPSPEPSTAPLSRAGRSWENIHILEASFFGCSSSKRKQILLLLNLISSFLLKDRKIFSEDGNNKKSIATYFTGPDPNLHPCQTWHYCQWFTMTIPARANSPPTHNKHFQELKVCITKQIITVTQFTLHSPWITSFFVWHCSGA